MKMQYFDRNLIREYMEGSPALEQGIRYMKYLDPSVSDAAAKESAIRYAIEKCEAIWMKDSTGYISSERIAFTEFSKDVREKRHFHDPAMDKAEKEEEEKRKNEHRWTCEKKRAADLRMLCMKEGLDFETENKKAVDELIRKNKLTIWIETIAGLSLVGSIIMWLFTAIGNYLLWLPIIVASIVALYIADTHLDPCLPNDFVWQIKNGTYDITK